MLLADRVSRIDAGPVDLAVLPTGVKDVVTLRGSIDTWPDFSNSGELAQEWLAQTLDKGSQDRDRFEIAGILEGIGARMGFSSSTARLRFSARFLAGDAHTVIPLLFEQLSRPALLSEELSKSRDRLAASIQRGRTDAGYRADVGLAAALMPVGHPNGMMEPDEELSALQQLDEDSPRSVHREQILTGRPRLALVGDLDVERVRDLMSSAAANWQPTGSLEVTLPKGEKTPDGSVSVDIADRDNLEVRWGRAVPMTRLHDDYLSAYMASFILGGNFSARLMEEVREKRGLTYGIGSSLWGNDARYGGMWRVHVTLSQENLDEGVKATEQVIGEFAAGGATMEELSEKQQTMTGAYKVRLATTGGIAATLLQRMEEGRPLSYLDTYPDAVSALTLDSVNDAVQKYFRADGLVRSVAGSLPAGWTG